MAQLTGRVLYPGDPGFDLSRKGFGSRFDYDAHIPRAIVYTQDVSDVCNAVKWARENSVPVRVRCGCHSYEGYSSLVKDGLLIDVSDMEMVKVSSKGDTAVVGAGIDMLELTERLCEAGVTFPLATGPSVGLSGLVLGGGFGITSRLLGTTADHLIEAEMVDANGCIVRASEKENSDLFWALRGGGGGNFGICTSYTFRVHKVGPVVVFNIGFPWELFDQVVAVWQDWAPNTDRGMTSILSLKVDRTVTLIGQFTAPPEQLGNAAQLLMPFMALQPISIGINALPYVIAARMLFGVDPLNPQWAIRQHGDNQLFKSAASFAYEPFPPEAITMLRKFLEEVPPLSAPPSQASMVQLLSGGGAIEDVPLDATAAYHRRSKFVVQYDGYWTAPQDYAPTYDWVVNMREKLLPYASYGYVNYHDATLKDFGHDYYGTNFERLVEVKAKWDPDNFFNFPQSIPLSVPVAASRAELL